MFCHATPVGAMVFGVDGASEAFCLCLLLHTSTSKGVVWVLVVMHGALLGADAPPWANQSHPPSPLSPLPFCFQDDGDVAATVGGDVNNDDNPFSNLASRHPDLGSAFERQQQQQQRNTRGSRGGAGGAGGEGGAVSPGEHDPLYPGGFSEDGVRAPLPAVTDRLIGGLGGGGGGAGGGAMLGGMLRGSMAVGAGGGSMEEKDNADWIFDIPEVGCSLFVVCSLCRRRDHRRRSCQPLWKCISYHPIVPFEIAQPYLVLGALKLFDPRTP